ncbi:MAG: hypothetical protein JOZ32_13270 [Bryobacterales bacterium]|nr:hypothetical protein [Bryobacterales bacterium]
METEKIGIRESRQNLAGYLEGGKTPTITRQGKMLGLFVSAQKSSRKAETKPSAPRRRTSTL